MWTPDVVLYHHPCNDGFAAAWACWKRWPDAEYLGVNYGHPTPPGLDGKNVLVVDFSYAPDVLRSMGAQSIVVLDHHKSAQKDLAVFSVPGPVQLNDVAHILSDEQNILASYDMECSGCRLAWRFAHPEHDMPALLKRIEDRDLWRFDFSDSRALHFYLGTVPMTFEVWDDEIEGFHDNPIPAVTQGRAIESYHDKLVQNTVRHARSAVVAGHTVPIVNAPPFLASDVGHELAKDWPFAVVWWEHCSTTSDTDFVTYSLRSSKNGLDVSEIAKMYGGGGHKHAAGFKIGQSLVADPMLQGGELVQFRTA